MNIMSAVMMHSPRKCGQNTNYDIEILPEQKIFRYLTGLIAEQTSEAVAAASRRSMKFL
jgi:hypothetical protein